MILYPQLPYATMIVFMEVAFACTGLVLYVVPLLLLVRVRQVLAS
jgi:hypothetical protein